MASLPVGLWFEEPVSHAVRQQKQEKYFWSSERGRGEKISKEEHEMEPTIGQMKIQLDTNICTGLHSSFLPDQGRSREKIFGFLFFFFLCFTTVLVSYNSDFFRLGRCVLPTACVWQGVLCTMYKQTMSVQTLFFLHEYWGHLACFMLEREVCSVVWTWYNGFYFLFFFSTPLAGKSAYSTAALSSFNLVARSLCMFQINIW